MQKDLVLPPDITLLILQNPLPALSEVFFIFRFPFISSGSTPIRKHNAEKDLTLQSDSPSKTQKGKTPQKA